MYGLLLLLGLLLPQSLKLFPLTFLLRLPTSLLLLHDLFLVLHTGITLTLLITSLANIK
jgi:hypothetical protein